MLVKLIIVPHKGYDFISLVGICYCTRVYEANVKVFSFSVKLFLIFVSHHDYFYEPVIKIIINHI